jgi:hypothetical protein
LDFVTSFWLFFFFLLFFLFVVGEEGGRRGREAHEKGARSARARRARRQRSPGLVNAENTLLCALGRLNELLSQPLIALSDPPLPPTAFFSPRSSDLESFSKRKKKKKKKGKKKSAPKNYDLFAMFRQRE